MRALADWYFTAHPPIMHDLHESLPLLYTYSGAAPQNPNLDPILFAELPWFSNFELAQMTKWGMPGVYTHAFMDGWSPGYLGSIAYNHNGMMRMYETQGGSEIRRRLRRHLHRRRRPRRRPGGVAAQRPRRKPARKAAEDAADAGAARRPAGEPQRRRQIRMVRPARRASGATGGAPTGRGGGQQREWYRGIPIPPGRTTTGRGGTIPTTCRPACCRPCSSPSRSPTWYSTTSIRKTRNSIESGKTEAPFGFVIPVQRDMTRVAELIEHPSRSANRGRSHDLRDQASAMARSPPGHT